MNWIQFVLPGQESDWECGAEENIWTRDRGKRGDRINLPNKKLRYIYLFFKKY
jgi:hypothetical protein